MQLSSPQHIFLRGLNKKFRAFVGGYGSGKTFVGCLDLLTFAIEHPKQKQGYFAPTYRDIRDIFWPTLEEAAYMMGFRVVVRKGDYEVDIFKGRWYYGTIICRPMFRPETIIGFKIVRAIVDEIDVFDKDRANEAWRKIIARLRVKIPGVVNGVGVTTTPEGFGFVYENFAADPKHSYAMVQASTYENEEYLPDDYIASLLETYPEQLVKAYIMGLFVNLRSGTVFYAFNRLENNTDVVAEPGERLRIGMDFNVELMAACVYVVRNGEWFQVDEFHHYLDTPHLIQAIKERYPDNPKIIYPDSTGKGRKPSDASVSDIKLLKREGWQVRVKSSNPLLKDRILSGNIAYEQKVVRVNVAKCPETVRCLEQLPYAPNGAPDKGQDLDHQVDAATYPIAYELAVKKPSSRIIHTTSL